MTAGLLRAVVEHALEEAKEHEAKVAEYRQRADTHERLALVLRELYAVAEPHVERPGQLRVVEERAA